MRCLVLLSNTYSNGPIISNCVTHMWGRATSAQDVVAECTTCSLCTGCYLWSLRPACASISWELLETYNITWYAIQWQCNMMTQHDMTTQHMWGITGLYKTKHIRKCNAKLARLPHLVTNSLAQPRDLPLQPVYAPLGSCQSCTGKTYFGKSRALTHTCIQRHQHTDTHICNSVTKKLQNSSSELHSTGVGPRLSSGKGQGWRAGLKGRGSEGKTIWGTLHTMRHRLPLADAAAMVWLQPPKLPLLENAWQDLWLCSLVVARTWVTLQQYTVRLGSTSTLLKYACASSGRPLLTVVWWADKAVYTPNRLLSNMCKVQDNSKNAAWQDVNVLIKQCWCQGASMSKL